MGNSCTIRWRWRSGRGGGGAPSDKWQPAVAVRVFVGGQVQWSGVIALCPSGRVMCLFAFGGVGVVRGFGVSWLGEG